MKINIEVFYKLILSFCVFVKRHAQSTLNKKFAYLCNISRKTGDEVGFLPADKHKSFLQDDRYAQSTQSNKLAMSLRYIKKNMKDEVVFLPADKGQRFLQTDTVILGVCGEVFPKFPKWHVFNVFTISQKRS